MTHIRRVIKNSLYLILEPLLLNIISIFVLGYIARSLGENHFGIFNFALSFAIIFQSFGRFGLNTAAVRDLAMRKDLVHDYFGRIFFLRLFMIGVAYLLTINFANLLGYTQETRIVVYLFGVLAVLELITEIFTDVFRAHERMELVSLVNFVAGIFLTILSVCVLLLGFKLYGVVLSYVAGKLLGLILVVFVYFRNFSLPQIRIDWSFYKSAMVKGLPLFLSSLLWLFITRMDIIILSKFSSMTDMGIYTAATILLTKLNVVPYSIASSVYPAISSLHNNSYEEGRPLCRKIFFLLVIIGLPAAIGVDIIAGQVIELIYGSTYARSIPILQVAIWAFPLTGILLPSVSVLFATNQQNKVVKVYSVSLLLGFIVYSALIKEFGILGAAIALVIVCAFQAGYMFYLVKDYVQGFISSEKLWGIIISNLLLAGLLLFIYRYNLFFIIALSIPFYLLSLRLFGIVMIKDILKLKTIFAGDRI